MPQYFSKSGLHHLRCVMTVAAVLFATLANAGPARAKAPELAIVDITVIDGTGGPPQPHMTVRIAEGRIKSIAQANRSSSHGLKVIDGRGKFLLPGFVEGNG